MSKDKSTPKTKITRIKAGAKSESKTSPKEQVKQPKVVKKTERTLEKVSAKKTKKSKARRNPIRRLGAYIINSFRELKLVKWPNRKETWSMTLSVLAYSFLLIVIVLLLDNLYKWLFTLIIK